MAVETKSIANMAAPDPSVPSSAHLGILERITLQMTASLHLEEVLTTITQGLVEDLGAAFARIWLLGPGDLCATCHPITPRHAVFTDQALHNTGVGWYASTVHAKRSGPVRVQLAPGVFTEMSRQAIASVGAPPQPDVGRYEVTLDRADRWPYRTPTLRD